MSKEEIPKLLDEMLRSEYSPPLTNAVVDAFLASETEASAEVVERIRSRFVEKVLDDIYPNPMRSTDSKLSFGRWIEQARERARLSRRDLGSVLSRDESFVASVETGVTLPWHLKSNELARIVALFKLHIDAVSELILRSFALGSVRLQGEVLARSHRGRMSLERGSSTRRALDLYLTRNAVTPEPNDEVANCIDKLREELRRIGASALLD